MILKKLAFDIIVMISITGLATKTCITGRKLYCIVIERFFTVIAYHKIFFFLLMDVLQWILIYLWHPQLGQYKNYIPIFIWYHYDYDHFSFHFTLNLIKQRFTNGLEVIFMKSNPIIEILKKLLVYEFKHMYKKTNCSCNVFSMSQENHLY